MKISRIASMLGLVAGLTGASSVLAANMCVNCNYLASGPSYIGALNPLTNDTSNFRRPNLQTPAATVVTDTWVFDIAPAGTFSLTASFNPFFGQTTRISNFSVTLRDVLGSSCTGVTYSGNPAISDTAGACTGGIVFGGLSVAGATSTSFGVPNGAAVFPVALLNPGRYAFQFTYNLAAFLDANGNGQESDYSGQISLTRTVPEPGTLALAGLALVGVAAGLRRARKA